MSRIVPRLARRPRTSKPFVKRCTASPSPMTIDGSKAASSPGGSDPGQVTPAVATWTDAQRRYTRAVLDGVPGRGEVEARLAALMDGGDVSLPLIRGNRYFYWYRNPAESPTVFTRDGALGEERALLRPTDVDPSGLTLPRWIMPSPDGRWLAVGTSREGEDAVLRLDRRDDRQAVVTRNPRQSRTPCPGCPTALASSISAWQTPRTGRAMSSCSISSTAIASSDVLLHRQYTPAENATSGGHRGTVCHVVSRRSMARRRLLDFGRLERSLADQLRRVATHRADDAAVS